MDNQSDRSFGEVAEQEVDTDEVETSEEISEETQESDTPDQDDSGESGKENQDTSEEQLTEKGTKLDPNPLSAAHQQLANERKIRQQYEQLLSNPQLLSQYIKSQYGSPVANQQVEQPEIKEYKADDFESLDDVANVVNNLQKSFVEKTKSYEEKIMQLSNAVSLLTRSATQDKVASNIEREVIGLQGIKELDPKSPEFIDGLEEEIVSLYHRLDFDENTGTYRGQYSIAEIGKSIVEAAKKARQAGSQKAQTIIKRKAEGRVTTSSKVEEETDDEKLSPEDSIAKGISQMFGGR
jgi:hypothetical protein